MSRGGADSYRFLRARPATGPAREMRNVQQIRHRRPRARRERPGPDVLPPEPYDPDVTRAKALARKRPPAAQGASPSQSPGATPPAAA